MKQSGTISHHRSAENYRDLLLVLLQKEIKVRYKDTFLGYIWSIANPLVFAFVYYVVFSTVMRVGIENYALILICGLFPWQWFSNSVASSSRLFLANASIIKKINFPRNIIVLSTCLNHMIHFLLTIPVILVFFLLHQKIPSISWLYGIPLLCVIHLTMVYGLALLIATLNLFLGDIERLVGILLNLIFYFTPIIYTKEMIPEEWAFIINLNPVGTLVLSWKALFLDGQLDWFYIGLTLLYTLLFLAIGQTVYRRFSWRFAEII